MLLCKVIVGDYCVGSKNMIELPTKTDGVTQYETMVNRLKDPTVFVVSKDYHALPKYVITFRCIR